MVKRSIIAILATVIFFKSGLFVFAAPVPLFYLYSVYGRKTALIALAIIAGIAFAALAARVSNVTEISYLGYFMLVAVILGEGVIRRFDVIRLAASAIVAPWAFAALCVAFCQFVLHVPIFESARALLTQTMEQVLKMQDAMSAFSPEQAAYVKGNIPELVNYALMMAPSATLLFGMLVVCLTILFTRSFTVRKESLKYFGNIIARRFPFWTVWVVIACAAAYFADVYLLKGVYLRFAALNGIFICAGLFFIEGYFVLSFWLHKKGSPFLRLVVWGLIIAFFQVMSIIIIALGFSDQWLDYRKKSLKTNATI